MRAPLQRPHFPLVCVHAHVCARVCVCTHVGVRSALGGGETPNSGAPAAPRAPASFHGSTEPLRCTLHPTPHSLTRELRRQLEEKSQASCGWTSSTDRGAGRRSSPSPLDRRVDLEAG